MKFNGVKINGWIYAYWYAPSSGYEGRLAPREWYCEPGPPATGIYALAVRGMLRGHVSPCRRFSSISYDYGGSVIIKL